MQIFSPFLVPCPASNPMIQSKKKPAKIAESNIEDELKVKYSYLLLIYISTFLISQSHYIKITKILEQNVSF